MKQKEEHEKGIQEYEKNIEIERDYMPNERVMIQQDVYNMTIAAVMTNDCPDSHIRFCV